MSLLIRTKFLATSTLALAAFGAASSAHNRRDGDRARRRTESQHRYWTHRRHEWNQYQSRDGDRGQGCYKQPQARLGQA